MKLNLYDKFRSLDIYGEPVALNYKGKGSYNTGCGAFYTIITFILMLFFAVKQVNQLINR
jgi:hypothetical protein